LAILAFATFQPFQVLPRMALSPGFALVDQSGRPVTSEDLRGHLVVYNFTYTGCESPCPQTSQVMQALQSHLPNIQRAGLPVDLVTISFDAEHDTPARLRGYAAGLQADPGYWHFLSSDAGRLKQVIGGGFDVYYAGKADGSFDFEPTFILVDGAGLVRARYRTAVPSLATIERDLELIAKEAQNSRGALRLAYEAAHLFLCYPQ
jgi:protein SCO1/2